MTGYFRSPTLFQDYVFFIHHDDLWRAPLQGGDAIRLTLGKGEFSDPSVSPDGKWIALTGTEEGVAEVYLMPFSGGELKRLTYWDDYTSVIGWEDPTHLILVSGYGQIARLRRLYSLNIVSMEMTELPVGPANFISFNNKKAVIQRHGYGYASWKRYQGGTAAELWIEREKGFEKLINVKHNCLRPFWMGERVYFASDMDGYGNLYSVKPDGQDLQRHTHHEDYYLKGLGTDGKTFVYTVGGDIYHYNPDLDKSVSIPIRIPSTEPRRKFVEAMKYLSDYSLSPDGTALALVTRGRGFTGSCFEGAMRQWGHPTEGQHRLLRWVGDKLISAYSKDCKEILEIYKDDQVTTVTADTGRLITLNPSPTDSGKVAFTNHRQELGLLNLETQEVVLIQKDTATYPRIHSYGWSPDGKWIVYSAACSPQQSVLKVYNLETNESKEITKPLLHDWAPSFDPKGKYIYFLSSRTFNPVPDQLHFEWSFPKGLKPYALCLQKETSSPFVPQLPLKEEPPKEDKKEGENIPEVRIDFEGIQDRLVEFPVREDCYIAIEGTADGKVLYLKASPTAIEETDEAGGDLKCYTFATQKEETIASDILSFTLSSDRKMIAYHSKKKVRILKAGDKPDDQDISYKRGGWFDGSRIRLQVNPKDEWVQIFNEAWVLQRDHYWHEKMGGIDWDEVYGRYLPLAQKVATRTELAEVISEMQGELGVSHAYVWGGDLKLSPKYTLGQLLADLSFDATLQAYRINHIYKGDPWNPKMTSPLNRPGLRVSVGDLIWSVGGQRVTATLSPAQLLVGQADNEVVLGVSGPTGEDKREVTLCPLGNTIDVFYRDWVENNRSYIHKKSQGRVGYIHIPDMSKEGFAEFHRSYLAECHKEGLIVDVRFNGGGNVSYLLLEKLSRKRLGYDTPRWGTAVTYPMDSPAGPMVALSNEYAGSDGDMFTYAFKALALGPVIGKRTWGGVIGIWPRHPLIDGGLTSQPEFAFWTKDEGWSIENKGVDPDIEVEITPEDYQAKRDPQLDRGLEEVLKQIEAAPQSKAFSLPLMRPNPSA